MLIIADRHDLMGPVGEWMEVSAAVRVFVGYVVVTNHWCWLAAIVGYAQRYLNKPNQKIQYLNRGVLPYYMMHQTIIVVLAFYLQPFNLPVLLEFLLILIGTVAGCAMTYELVKNRRVVGGLFGLKQAKYSHNNAAAF